MSNNAAVPKVKQSSSLHMIATLTGVAFFSGFLIFFVVQATEGGIRQNRIDQLRGAVFEVLPEATSSQGFAVENGTFRPIDIDDPTPGLRKIYAGYDDSGALVGVAIEAAAQGYQDVIRGIYGYDPFTERVVGFSVLESSETPGLGDRIAHDPSFLENFFETEESPDTVSLALDDEGDALEQPLSLVDRDEKTEPWEVEGISGATVSCLAVVRMLNQSAQEVVPLIHTHLDQLQKGTL